MLWGFRRKKGLISTIALFISQKIPLSDLERIDNEKYKKVVEENNLFLKYNLYCKARSLGMVFNASDFDVETINLFYEIESKMSEYAESKNSLKNTSKRGIKNGWWKTYFWFSCW